MSQVTDPNNLYRISIQITNSQYKLLKHYSRPGTSISSMIRRAIDEMFEPVREQAIEDAKYEKGPFTISNTTEKISMRARGRQARIRVSCDSTGTSWRWGSLRMALQKDGGR